MINKYLLIMLFVLISVFNWDCGDNGINTEESNIIARLFLYKHRIPSQILPIDTVEEYLLAFFDSSATVYEKLYGGYIFCNNEELFWNELNNYYWGAFSDGFLEFGEIYTVEVVGSGKVSPFNISIAFPNHMPFITSPPHDSTVSLHNGFNVTWDDTGVGDIRITMHRSLSTYVVFDAITENDGEYFVIPDSLSSCSTGTYNLTIINSNEKVINNSGFDSSESFIEALTSDFIHINIE